MTLYEILRGNQPLLFFTALIFWFILNRIVTFILSNHRKSQPLPCLIRTYLAESCISSVQGFACGGIGVIGVLNCRHNVMTDKCDLVVFYCTFGAGYFVYDIIAMFSSNYKMMKSIGSDLKVYNILSTYASNHWLMVTHHIILISVLFPALITYSKMGHFFASCFFCMEISSPLVNFRVVLSKLQMKRSSLYVANGVTMMIVFAFCRVLIFPYMYFSYCIQIASLKAMTILEAFYTIPLLCHLYCGLILTPQLYWLSLMVSGVVAVIGRYLKIIDKVD